MPSLPGIDQGIPFDWGKTSADYSTWRPTYPDRFFELLKILGVGLDGQSILDLGTGVGFLALRFAQQGAIATGVDISTEQIGEARRRAKSLGVAAKLIVAPAEETALPPASFDAITASQSWLYFDAARAIAEVKRVLLPHGLLVISSFGWLPRQDPIAHATEQLVLQHNPKWTAADWPGSQGTIPKWAEADFDLHAFFAFHEPIPFTRESWRGRLRACRGIGATLTAREVEEFDRAHAELLHRLAPEQFTVLHRIEAHILKVKP